MKGWQEGAGGGRGVENIYQGVVMASTLAGSSRLGSAERRETNCSQDNGELMLIMYIT